VFDAEGKLDNLEAFASLNGPRFYGLPVNEGRITLERAEVKVPDRIESAGIELVPFHAGETLGWKLAG
jgi:dihydroorotase